MNSRHKMFLEVIKELHRRDLNLVAEQANITKRTLYNWIHGETVSPLFNNLVKVAGAMGMELRLERVATKLRKVG